MDNILSMFAVLVALGVFVVCGLFASGKWRPEPETKEGEAAAADKAEEKPSITQRITTLALVAIKGAAGRDDAGVSSDRPGVKADKPRTPDDETPDLDDPFDDWDGQPDEDEADAPRPPIWADTEVIRTTRPDQPAAIPDAERKQIPPSPIGDPPPAPRHDPEPAPPGPSGPGGPGLPPVPPELLKPADHSPRQPHPQATAPPMPQVLVADQGTEVLSGTEFIVEPVSVALEGVDMSQAPLVPSGDGAVARVPTTGQLSAALATGGIARLRAWLKAFINANKASLDGAHRLHTDALAVARRANNKYMIALTAIQKVQADRLDARTVNRFFEILAQAHAEAVAAAAVTRHTAQLVVAAGGAQPPVAAALSALDQHGGMEAAIKSAPVKPVPNTAWYQQ